MRRVLKTIQQSLRRAPIIHRTIRSVWTPPERVYQHLYFDGPFTVKVGDASFRMEHFGAQIENDLFWRGYGNGFEGRSLKLWAELCKSASVIVDVGANTGVYALAAKALNPSAKVIAIEPSRDIARRLRRNVRLNAFDIEVIEVAVSDASGFATFYEFSGEHHYSASLNAAMGGTVPVSVPVRRLDDLLDRADLIKIDVERHEPAVLRGAERLLESHPTLLIEVLDAEAEQDIRQELDGYDWQMIEEDRNALLTAATALNTEKLNTGCSVVVPVCR